MRAELPLLVLVLAFAGCGTPELPGQVGARQASSVLDEQGLIEAHDAWARAYERGDVEALIDLLDPEARLIFHPRRFHRFDDVDEIRQGLGGMFLRLGRSTWSDVHLEVHSRGNIAWLTSHVVVDSEKLPEPFVGRGTEIWIRTGEHWRLRHGHWSPDPEG